jgi:hypothetical protein
MTGRASDFFSDTFVEAVISLVGTVIDEEAAGTLVVVVVEEEADETGSTDATGSTDETGSTDATVA